MIREKPKPKWAAVKTAANDVLGARTIMRVAGAIAFRVRCVPIISLTLLLVMENVIGGVRKVNDRTINFREAGEFRRNASGVPEGFPKDVTGSRKRGNLTGNVSGIGIREGNEGEKEEDDEDEETEGERRLVKNGHRVREADGGHGSIAPKTEGK